MKELLRRLEAAEAEIRQLKSQKARSAPTVQLEAPVELGDVVPTNLNMDSPAHGDLANRVIELEKKCAAQEEAGANKRAEFPTFKLRGRVDADTVWSSQSSANRATVGDAQDGADLRRARLGVEGLLFENVDYVFEVDFAGDGRPSFTSAFATVMELPLIGNLRVGYYREPFSLELVTSSRYVTFMERSVLSQAFGPGRNLGVSIFNNTDDEMMTWAIGVFKTGSDNFGDDVGDEGENSLTTRLTWTPYYDECSGGRYLLHVGGAYSFRDADEGVVSFASRPEISMRTSSTSIGGSGEGSFPNFVSTGSIPAHNHQLFGAEAALEWGSLSIQSEYIATLVDRTAGNDAFFQGAYVFVSYFLTGEHRPYNRQPGGFDRVRPHENFISVCTDDGVRNGWGAWELRARYSWIDLNDAGIKGGMMNDFTLGVTWYLNPNFKIMLDYIHSDLDRGADGGDADIVAMRAHFDW